MDCLVTEIPMVVVDEFEIWKGEFLLKECCEFFLNRFCPTALWSLSDS